MPRVFCYILNMETITNFTRQNPNYVFRPLTYRQMLGHAHHIGDMKILNSNVEISAYLHMYNKWYTDIVMVSNPQFDVPHQIISAILKASSRLAHEFERFEVF